MKRLATLIFLAALIAVAAAAYLLLAPLTPPGETFVDVPSGTGSAGIAARLEKAGVIRSRYAFELERLRRAVTGKGGTLKAGEYRFVDPADTATIYARIARGDIYTRALAIPEGFNLFDIAHAVEAAHLGSADEFLAAARRQTSLIADLNPHAQSLEGYLFPATYQFRRSATIPQILQTMVDRFRATASRLGLLHSPNLARTVILASLVEKEVGVDSERPMVAGVFENRIADGMKLQTDPTVIYAALLAGRWRGVIHQSDLAFDSPYNTYRSAGLPPGPIANPGVAALRAAMHPAATNDLYFVADAQGHTRFSATLAEHQHQVEDYRAATRSRP